jgi:hypothetical protein
MNKPLTNEDAPMRTFEFYSEHKEPILVEAQELREGPGAVSLVRYRGNMGYIVASIPYSSYDLMEASVPEAEELEELNKRLDVQLEEAKAKLIQTVDLSEMDDIFGKVN